MCRGRQIREQGVDSMAMTIPFRNRDGIVHGMPLAELMRFLDTSLIFMVMQETGGETIKEQRLFLPEVNHVQERLLVGGEIVSIYMAMLPW